MAFPDEGLEFGCFYHLSDICIDSGSRIQRRSAVRAGFWVPVHDLINLLRRHNFSGTPCMPRLSTSLATRRGFWKLPVAHVRTRGLRAIRRVLPKLGPKLLHPCPQAHILRQSPGQAGFKLLNSAKYCVHSSRLINLNAKYQAMIHHLEKYFRPTLGKGNRSAPSRGLNDYEAPCPRWGKPQSNPQRNGAAIAAPFKPLRASPGEAIRSRTRRRSHRRCGRC